MDFSSSKTPRESNSIKSPSLSRMILNSYPCFERSPFNHQPNLYSLVSVPSVLSRLCIFDVLLANPYPRCNSPRTSHLYRIPNGSAQVLRVRHLQRRDMPKPRTCLGQVRV